MPRHPSKNPSRPPLRAIGGLLSSLLLAGAFASPISITDVPSAGNFDFGWVANVCSDRVILLPSITSDPNQTAFGVDFGARVVAGIDRNSEAPYPMQFSKSSAVFDEFRGGNGAASSVAIPIDDWSNYPDPHLQIVIDPLSGKNELVWIALPPYTPPTYAGGSGTLSDPYLVSTAEQLQQIACQSTDRAWYYALTNDIDLSGRNFFPLGVSGAPFRGGIDGRGYAIRSLTMDWPSNAIIGFFGSAQAFFLRDVHFDAPSVRGTQYVGVVAGKIDLDDHVGAGNVASSLQGVTITDATVRGALDVGGVAGAGMRLAMIDPQIDVELVFTPAPYHGPTSSALSTLLVGVKMMRFGGLLGYGSQTTVRGGTLDVRITQDPIVADAGRLANIAGLVGSAEKAVHVSDFQARVYMDLEPASLDTGSSSNGGLFGEYFDDGSTFTDSVADLDITLRAFDLPGVSQNITTFGGVSGSVEEASVSGSVIRGTITIDVTASTEPITVERIGGVFGRTLSYGSTLQESHVAVDLVILGTSLATVRDIGGIVGYANHLVASNVRVDGSIRVENADADAIGGLVGTFEATPPRFTASSVIYRGEGVSVAGTSTNVGPLWGDVLYSTGAGASYHGANVYWDADRNGVTAFTEAELGRPASSAQLADLGWLTTTASFDAEVWCVTPEDAVAVPAVIALTPDCRHPIAGPTAPTAPTNLQATVGDGRVTLRWNPPASDGGSVADVAVVQVRPLGRGSWSTLRAPDRCVPDTATCAVATGLENGQAYEFRVAAENEVGRSPWSSALRATPGTTPSAPSVAVAPGDQRVTLTWSVPSEDGGYPILGYEVEMTMGVGGAWSSVTPLACATPDCGSVEGLTNGATYAFRIAAVNALGRGTWSDPATAQPLVASTAPNDLVAVAGDRTVTLTWLPPTDTGGLSVTYLVEVAEDGGAWATATTASCPVVEATCAVVPDLVNGVSYAFRVTAITAAGASPPAGPVLATPQPPADVPLITRTIAGPERGWLIVAPPTAAVVGYELSLDDGATWQAVAPHVGDRVIRITGLTNGATVPTRLRSVRADGTRSASTGTHVIMPTPIRVTAPELLVAVDPESLTVDRSTTPHTLTIDLTLTNSGATTLHDAWLTWTGLPQGNAIASVVGLTEPGAWHALDAWWYGEGVEIAPGATHRVRVTLEAQP